METSWPAHLVHTNAYVHLAKRPVALLAPVDSDEHHYRVMYLDNTDTRYIHEHLFKCPARTGLLDALKLLHEQNKYLLDDCSIISLCNLSLRNGLPLPF